LIVPANPDAKLMVALGSEAANASRREQSASQEPSFVSASFVTSNADNGVAADDSDVVSLVLGSSLGLAGVATNTEKTSKEAILDAFRCELLIR
jgi:hypothetical protein